MCSTDQNTITYGREDQISAPFFLFYRLELSHEFAIDIILDSKCQTAAELDPPLVKYAGTVSQVEYQQIFPPGSKGLSSELSSVAIRL